MVSGVMRSTGAVALRSPIALAQVGQRLVEAQVRRALGPLGPQQPGQRRAPMRPIGFERQVGQQRAHLVRFESGDSARHPARICKRAEQRKRQMRHQEPSDPMKPRLCCCCETGRPCHYSPIRSPAQLRRRSPYSFLIAGW